MKRNTLTLIVGSLLVLIFALWLCAFQVRTTEVAVVTTFGKPTRDITNANWYFKWPPPIQVVHRLDQRVQNLEDKFTEDLMADGKNLLSSVYIGWRITEPQLFFPKFAGGSMTEAQKILTDLVRSSKSAVVGKHPLSDFISTSDTSKFAAIEREILEAVQAKVRANNYGITIEFLGIKRLGLPESVSQTVFDHMISERQFLVAKIENEGNTEAAKIKSDAERQASEKIAAAKGEALRIQGQGEAEALSYLSTFQQNPELAVFLFQLNALEAALKDRATLIFDQRNVPFNLFAGFGTNRVTK